MAAEPATHIPTEHRSLPYTPERHPHPVPEQPEDEIVETMENRAEDIRIDDDISPRTIVAENEGHSDTEELAPPVPPVPRQLSSRGSRGRVRRAQPKDYSSDPQTYGQEPPRLMSMRSNRTRFHDEWYESDPPSGADRAWREEVRHPDNYDRRHHSRHTSRHKPPRTHLNSRASQQFENSSTKQWVEETRGYHDPFSPMHHPQRRWYYDEEQGYNPAEPRATYSSDSLRIQWNNLTPSQKAEVLRLPWLHWMNSEIKNHFVASLGEFVGTTLFLFFAFAGTEVANIQSNANGSSSSSSSNTTTGATTGFNINVLLYISVAFGFSLMVNVWVFFRISGGLFNPAVTVALVLIRAITIARAICLFFSQILGGIMASVLVRFLFPENFNVRTTLGGGASLAQGVFIEALLTAELVFTIYMLAAEKHRATFIAPVGIGLALFIAEMVGVEFTGGSLNPARSFGPCVVTATFDSEHWIYWVGPFMGALIAYAFYRFIKTLEYEMANPGADGDPLNDPTKNPEKRAAMNVARQKTSLSSMRE